MRGEWRSIAFAEVRLQPMQDELVRLLHPQNQSTKETAFPAPHPSKNFACGALGNKRFSKVAALRAGQRVWL